jgi:vacuolar-type H+-ATPase subunit E/Vma4
MSKIEGDLALFVERVLKDIFTRYMEELSASLQQAYDTSKSLITSAYEEAVRKSVQIVTDYYNDALGEIRAYEVSLDRDNKIEIQNMETSLINEVLGKVYEKLVEIPMEEKEKLYKKLLMKVANETGEEKLILYIAPSEADIIKKIIDEKQLWSRITLQEDKSIDHGFIITNLDKTIFYDYTFRTIFESIKPYLMSKARAMLFGDKNERWESYSNIRSTCCS